VHSGYKGLSEYVQRGKVDGLRSMFCDPEPEQVAVLYRNGYLRSCREALAARFPVVATAMGEAEFRATCYAYIEAHPPLHRTLTGFGLDFPAWLAQFQPARHHPGIVDLAQLDGAWLDCLYGPDEPALTAQRLHSHIQASGTLPDNLRLLRNARLVELNYPVADAWVLARDTGDPQNRPASLRADFMLFWRPEMSVLSRNLQAWEVDFYQTLIATDNLEKASLQYADTNTAVPLEKYFAQLIEACVLTLGDDDDVD
jgi:hypothetical protein